MRKNRGREGKEGIKGGSEGCRIMSKRNRGMGIALLL
jgi:L-asparaginase II